MADKIKGITVEIGGDTTGLSKALSGVNKDIKNTQAQLKDVNRLLKMDLGKTELITQKQKLLAQAFEETKNKAVAGQTSAIVAAMGSAGGDIVIPVYIGNTLLDEIVVGAQNRMNLKSGGR